MSQNLVRAVFTVFGFWWIVFAVAAIGWADIDLALAVKSAASLALLCALGVGVGGAGVVAFIWSEKEAKKALLQGEAVRGLICTIGELPLIAKEPVQAPAEPDLKTVPDVPADFYAAWFKRYDVSHPAHTSLMRVFLRVYENTKALPATHIAGGHGGRTLLEHSLLAGYFMDKLAHDWSYTGLRDRTGKRIILKLRDSDYKFNADDPLIALIGVAHDIGKIEAYIYEKNSAAIIGIHHEHDLTGARMIARLPEVWSLPDEDRRAMFLAIAHYHHPMELPLSPDRRAIDDRTIALMELLIKTDFVTSRVEAKGAEPTEAEYEDAGKGSATTEVSGETVWEALVEIISEHGRINSADPRFNVATLCACDGFDKPMLLIKEDSIRSALLKRLRVQSATLLGDGRYQLTVDMLKLLEAKGLLVRTIGGAEYSAENALWNVDFLSRPSEGATPVKKSGWSAVIIVDPKITPRVAQIDPYWWFAVVQRNTMGAARALNKKGGGSADKRRGANLLEMDDEEMGRQLENATLKPVAPAPKPKGAGTSKAQAEPAAVPTAPVAAPADQMPATTPLEVAAPVPVVAVDPGTRDAAGSKPSTAMVLDAVWDESGPEAEQEPGQDQQGPETVLVGEAQGAAESPAEASEAPPPVPVERERVIAPIDVRRGLLLAIREAQARNTKLRQLNGRFLVSNATLNDLVPHIDWNACRYKLEQLCKGGRLDAMFVQLGDKQDFALAFREDITEGLEGDEP